MSRKLLFTLIAGIVFSSDLIAQDFDEVTDYSEVWNNESAYEKMYHVYGFFNGLECSIMILDSQENSEELARAYDIIRTKLNHLHETELPTFILLVDYVYTLEKYKYKSIMFVMYSVMEAILKYGKHPEKYFQ